MPIIVGPGAMEVDIADSFNPADLLTSVVIPATDWVAQFRIDFPEFANANVYPNGVINFWYKVAQKFLDPCRWDTCLETGLELYVAHNIVLQKQNQRAADAGGDPGLRSGVIVSENSGDQSVSYDVSSTTEKDAGFWNMTSYGKQYIHLARLIGAGPMYVGAGSSPFGTGAWAGPPPWPGWFSS